MWRGKLNDHAARSSDVGYRLERYRQLLRSAGQWKRSWRELWWTARSLVPRIGAGAVLADGASKQACWVLHECWRSYTDAPTIAKRCFPYILRELMCEIRARRKDLGTTTHKDTGSEWKMDVLQGSGTNSRSVVLEIPIPPVVAHMLCPANAPCSERGARGAVTAMLTPSIFWSGGRYVAKYVRRSNGSSDDETTSATAGELGRSSVFVVHRHEMVWTLVNTSVLLRHHWKSLRHAFLSRHFRLLTKLVLHAVVSFLRYTLTVVSLSFNITMVSMNFNFEFDKVEKLLAYFRERLDWSVWRLVSWFKLDGILDWLNRVLEFLDIDLFLVEYECISGVLLYVFLAMLVGAAFLMYVVVRADLLLKLQKWHTMVDIPLDKSTISFCEQVGTLLVVPFYLSVKSVVLYMASSLSGFFWYTYQKPTALTLTELKLFTTATTTCPSVALARFNVFAGFVALMLIITFVFLCLPLLVLDLYTWAPLPPPHTRKDAAMAVGKRTTHTNTKSSSTGIRTAVQQGEFLVQWNSLACMSRTVASLPWVGPKWRASTRAVGNTRTRVALWCTSRMPPTVAVVWRHPMFQDYDAMYSDFYAFPRDQIVAKYGLVGAAWIFFRVYFHLMVQSIVRGVGDLAWWRLSHEDMYPTRQMQPTSRQWWKRINRMCLCFNFTWKIRYMLHRMLQPLYNVMLITLGIWGEYQWQTFQVEERANEAFSMEPSGEARQLQLMALQGKVVSLFWLCFPRTTFLSIFAEILNTGPLLTYFFNPKFLQADIPETEREAKPKWRLHTWPTRKNDTDVFFLSKHTTLFVVTALKGASALVQVAALLSVYWPWRVNPINAYRWLLSAAAVTPVLEFNHAAVTSYLDYVERVETTNATMTSDTTVHETNDTDTSTDKNSLDTAYKAKKDLIVLDAMPRVSYVVLADALDDHEGELTISWQVNASQRYHKHDAIGMFPVRAPGDVTRRTMRDCICYRLLEETQSQQFGWHEPRKRVAIESKAVDTREQRIPLQALCTAAPSESSTTHAKEIEVVILGTDDAVTDAHAAPPPPPQQQQQQRQLRERSAPNPLLAKQGRATSKVFQITREARKIVNGQVKFRPVNNCVLEDDPSFERFTYGNDAGIYQAKYGLHAYEFCYLRYYDDGTRDNSKRRTRGKKNGTKNFVVQPILASSARELPAGDAATASYEVLGEFLSNPIQIGTFNIYMSLTCAQPLVRANDRLDLSWTINGVPYSILSDPKTRNCIGFFKVSDSASATSASSSQHCARIEMLPSSAFLVASDDKPCAGRVTVTTPREPGLYEIRFLLNYFKASQLHRLCQVFGDLEDEMQQLRIRSVYEQRAVVDALRGFAALERDTWHDARSATRLWLSSMLRSALRELENETLMSSQSRVAKPTAMLVQAFTTKLHVAQTTTATSSSVFARTLALMTKPLDLSSFYDVLVAAYESNSQLEDQLASITFMSPTANDKKTRTEPGNVERYQLFVPRSDANILLYGDYAFEFEAESYLATPSLCGFHDFLDDLLLNHKQLLDNLEQIVTSVSSRRVTVRRRGPGRAHGRGGGGAEPRRGRDARECARDASPHGAQPRADADP